MKTVSDTYSFPKIIMNIIGKKIILFHKAFCTYPWKYQIFLVFHFMIWVTNVLWSSSFSFLFLNLFLNFTVLYWFCHISKWIRHRHTRVPHPELILFKMSSLQQKTICDVVFRVISFSLFCLWRVMNTNSLIRLSLP